MAVTNHFFAEIQAFDEVERAVSATYTTKVGSTSDNFIVDRVITVTDPADNFTITVTNGTVEGQRLLISFLNDSESKTVTVTCTTGSDYSLTAAGHYASLEWVGSSSGWVALSSKES